jgi:hypothetical protein
MRSEQKISAKYKPSSVRLAYSIFWRTYHSGRFGFSGLSSFPLAPALWSFQHSGRSGFPVVLVPGRSKIM